MTSRTTFYLSRVLGNQIYNAEGKSFGRVLDLVVEHSPQENEPRRPRVTGIKVKLAGQKQVLDISKTQISKIGGQYIIQCNELSFLSQERIDNSLFLAESILDQQIVDINGRKLVRVNDIRLAMVSSGAFAVAVDIGMEGLLRRIGIAKPIKSLLALMNVNLPAKFILWDDVEAVDSTNFSIKLSKTHSKLHTLHPSDLADIIEELGRNSQNSVFSSLDEEQAADVLEELETETQIQIIESLPLDKAADVLEKMPADEVADILNELGDEKAEQLLKEMEKESSAEVRELLEYSNNMVGSIMTTEHWSFNQDLSVDQTLKLLRIHKPEKYALYSLFVTDKEERFVSTVSIRDLVISEPDMKLKQIMKKSPVFVQDTDRLDSLAEILSKYNLLAIPVIDEDKNLKGMVVIDDIIEDLLNKRKTK